MSDGDGGRLRGVSLDQMLGEYYAVRGWKEGVVPEDKLAELQIP